MGCNMKINFTRHKGVFGENTNGTFAVVLDNKGSVIDTYMILDCDGANGKVAFVEWVQKTYPALGIYYKIQNRKTKAERRALSKEWVFATRNAYDASYAEGVARRIAARMVELPLDRAGSLVDLYWTNYSARFCQPMREMLGKLYDELKNSAELKL